MMRPANADSLKRGRAPTAVLRANQHRGVLTPRTLDKVEIVSKRSLLSNGERENAGDDGAYSVV